MKITKSSLEILQSVSGRPSVPSIAAHTSASDSASGRQSTQHTIKDFIYKLS